MTTENQHAIENAQAWLENIVQMVKRLEHAGECSGSELTCELHAIHEDGTPCLIDSGSESFGFSDYHDADAAREAIEESPLSIEVRSGWLTLAQIGEHWQNVTNGKELPLTSILAEYKILLTWGGPALRLVGELDQYGEPETARLEYQDWGTPWTDFNFMQAAPSLEDATSQRDALLTYARQFYYGS